LLLGEFPVDEVLELITVLPLIGFHVEESAAGCLLLLLTRLDALLG
jgi:hypothetical protein